MGWIPFCLLGIYRYLKKNYKNPELFLAIAFRITMCTLSDHKEDRFILPTLGPLLIFVSLGLIEYKEESS